jgi:hypothetical protein
MAAKAHRLWARKYVNVGRRCDPFVLAVSQLSSDSAGCDGQKFFDDGLFVVG